MSELFGNKYKTETIRLKSRDYSNVGFYFVTICVKNRFSLPFGNIKNNEINLSNLGNVAEMYWKSISDVYLHVEIDQFIIMPDHIHGLLFITKKDKTSWDINKFGPQKMNLGSIIRGFKGRVKTFANKNNIDFERQPGYYDRVVRNENELLKIQQYIIDNPSKRDIEKEVGIWM